MIFLSLSLDDSDFLPSSLHITPQNQPLHLFLTVQNEQNAHQ